MINSTDILSKIPDLNKYYTTAESRRSTVAILGSSENTGTIDKYLKACSDITQHFIKNGFNIVHGCGTRGIMGEAYNAAQNSSIKDSAGKPLQSLAIIVEPLWGDENLKDCVLIGKAANEAERIAKFSQTADNFLVFPGSATTLQEASTVIQNNRYLKSGEAKKVVLFGSDFWEGLINQYKKFFQMNLLKENPIGKLFDIANSKEEVIKLILKK